MPSPSKTRLIQNALLLLVIAALALVLLLPQADKNTDSVTLYDADIGDEAHEIGIHVEGQEDILIKNLGGVWTVVQPTEFVANREKVQQLFTLLAEQTDRSYSLAGLNLADYGLEDERLSIRFNKVNYVLGQYNPVAQKRYIKKGNKMYLVTETISGLLQQGLDAFRVAPAKPAEKATEQ